jgi:hypothetical protein
MDTDEVKVVMGVVVPVRHKNFFHIFEEVYSTHVGDRTFSCKRLAVLNPKVFTILFLEPLREDKVMDA